MSLSLEWPDDRKISAFPINDVDPGLSAVFVPDHGYGWWKNFSEKKFMGQAPIRQAFFRMVNAASSGKENR
jgi:hypothetical protein